MHALSCHHGGMANHPEDTFADPDGEFSDDSIAVPLVEETGFEVIDVIPSGMGPALTRPIPDHASPGLDAFAEPEFETFVEADLDIHDGLPQPVLEPEADEPSETWPSPERAAAPAFEQAHIPALEP